MYVIYHIASTMQMGPTKGGHPASWAAKTYKTYGAALRTATKWNTIGEQAVLRYCPEHPGEEGKVMQFAHVEYGVASVEHYRTRVVRKVERTNLLSGQKFTEDSNTPGYCSPSSEAYWSM